MKNQLHCGEKIHRLALHYVLHKLHQHLGVGVAAEGDALLLQLLLQVGIVLDDAVVNYREVLRLRVVRVRITRRRLAMRCPSCVRYTYGARDVQ